MIRKALRDWPVKLGALVLGVLVWFFVGVGNDEVGQATLLVPVVLEGLSPNQTPIGVPETVTVEASGQRTRVTRLRAENFDASLDLSGVFGAFQQEIVVVPPQGITVTSVSPAEASGTVETISSEVLSVSVALLGAPPADALLNAQPEPAEATVRGRGSLLEQVAALRAVVPAQAGVQEALLFAVDEDGLPIGEVTLEPERVQVTVSETPILHSKTLPLEVAPPEVEGFRLEDFTLLDEALTISGPRSALEELQGVTGAAIPATPLSEAGEYTLNVTPQLPEGVAALGTARVQFRLVEDDPADGDTDDLPSAPLRRPDPTQNGQPSDPL